MLTVPKHSEPLKEHQPTRTTSTHTPSSLAIGSLSLSISAYVVISPVVAFMRNKPAHESVKKSITMVTKLTIFELIYKHHDSRAVS